MLFESPADPALTPTPREAYLRTMLGAIEMLQRGITSVQDDAFLMPVPRTGRSSTRWHAAYRDCGIRAYRRARPTRAARDREAARSSTVVDARRPRGARRAGARCRAAQLLEAYDHLIGTWHGAADGRLRAAVSISAPQRVSLEYFAALDDLAERHGLPLYAHMLETKVQRTLMTEQPRFAGRSLVQYTADLGLLKPAHQRHPRRLGGRRRPRPHRRGGLDGRAQPGQQPATRQRRAAVPRDAEPRHPDGARHRRGDLRRRDQHVERGQDRGPDPQRLRPGQRRLANGDRGARPPCGRAAHRRCAAHG